MNNHSIEGKLSLFFFFWQVKLNEMHECPDFGFGKGIFPPRQVLQLQSQIHRLHM